MADPYPDVPDDADGADALVRVLSEWDTDNFKKAVALVALTRREYLQAMEAGNVPGDPTFEEFVDEVDGQWSEAAERMSEE